MHLALISREKPGIKELRDAMIVLERIPELCLHLRLPGLETNALLQTNLEKAFKQVNPSLWARVRVHDHVTWFLQQWPQIGGVHFNRRMPYSPEQITNLDKEFQGNRSYGISLHPGQNLASSAPSAQENFLWEKLDYAWVSPVFDSVSKKRHTGKIYAPPKELNQTSCWAVAGIGPQNAHLPIMRGFRGAALMGRAWQAWEEGGIRELQKLMEHMVQAASIPKLYALLTEHPSYSMLAQSRALLKAYHELSQGEQKAIGGFPMLQYRKKTGVDKAEVQHIQKALGWHSGKLVINDSVPAALEQKTGAHLGLRDGNWMRARARLANTALLGITVHHALEAAQAIPAKPDYLGIGPVFRSPTKPELTRPLGLRGLNMLLAESALPSTRIPLYAIGGITAKRAKAVLGTGVHGLALSSGLWGSGPISTRRNFDLYVKEILHG